MKKSPFVRKHNQYNHQYKDLWIYKIVPETKGVSLTLKKMKTDKICKVCKEKRCICIKKIYTVIF